MFRKSVKHMSVLATAAALTVGLGVPQSASASDPFIGQITMFGGNFAPRNWAQCDGQLLPISQNTALFSILGTTYGGDGRTTFGLPELRGRTAVHYGNGPGLSQIRLGQKGGAETVTLNMNNLPSHNHSVNTTVTSTLKGTDAAGDSTTPGGNILASKARTNSFKTSTAPDVDMHPGSVANTVTTTEANVGGGVAFGIRSPYTAINHIIALVGVFPSRN